MKALLTCSLAVLLLGGVATGGDTKKDQDILQGKWLAEVDGKKGQLVLAKDKFTFTLSDGNQDFEFKGKFKIEPSKKPKHIDFAIEEGPVHVGDTARGIYELDGDTLKWCVSAPGKDERPTAFPAAQGGNEEVLYFICKRVK